MLAELSGTWEGQGFNLIARPEASGKSPLFLELNQTFETLTFNAISSSIPNRGDAVPDIELFGLTYLQKVVDLVTQGALHIEPGIWVHIPSGDAGGNQRVARMGNIPHGNSLLAQGIALLVDPVPAGFDPDKTAPATTAPFHQNTPMPLPGTPGAFKPFNLSDLSPAAVDFRTPVGNPPNGQIPATILGLLLQDVINDPVKLLTAALNGQVIEKMAVIEISTIASIPVVDPANPAKSIPKNFPGGGGGIENIPFLQTNADAATMFATFWIEEIQGPTPDTNFFQLQYVQTVFLNFPIIAPPATPVPFTWPHVSVATLRKVFGGQ
ncbi:MAG: heme-binding protein [Puia sp.]|nr:heme-binding protein [Puia sp.]